MIVLRAFIVVCLSILSLSACKSGDSRDGWFFSPAEEKVRNIIRSNSKTEQKYKGFYNLYDVNVTQMNSLVQAAILERSADALQWDANEQRDARERNFQEMSTGSTFVISLFTPDRAHNELQKPNSMWKVYLEANGQRYPAKIEKSTTKALQLEPMLPYRNRFSTIYYATFSVPMTSLERGPCAVTMTSSLGTSTFHFGPLP